MSPSATTLRVARAAEVMLVNGTWLSGQVFVEEDSRTQDLLNDARPFFPLITENDEVFLLNKSAVIQVRAHDRRRRGGRRRRPPVDSAGGRPRTNRP